MPWRLGEEGCPFARFSARATSAESTRSIQSRRVPRPIVRKSRAAGRASHSVEPRLLSPIGRSRRRSLSRRGPNARCERSSDGGRIRRSVDQAIAHDRTDVPAARGEGFVATDPRHLPAALVIDVRAAHRKRASVLGVHAQVVLPAVRLQHSGRFSRLSSRLLSARVVM